MNITTSIRLHDGEDNNFKGFADVTIDNMITIKNVKILNGKNGLFSAMPSRKDQNGNYQSICYMAKDCRQEFNDAVINAYREAYFITQEQELSEAEQEACEEFDEDPDPLLHIFAQSIDAV